MKQYLKPILTGLVIFTICYTTTRASVSLSPLPGQPDPVKLIRGMNGHPLNQIAYRKISLPLQFEMLKQLSVNYYRFDVPIDSDGNIKNSSSFHTMEILSATHNIGLLPMIYMVGLNYNDNAKTSFAKGYKIGNNFAKKYGRTIKYYELGNEQELAMSKKGTSGSSPDDYDINKVKIAAAYWKGMIAGIKKKYPAAKTIINCGGWFHYSFFKLLDKENVDYDIIGYHWYSNMDDYAKSVNVDISKVISQQFKKPVWFTEVNLVNGTNKKTEQDQEAWIKQFTLSCQKYPAVQAIFIYELLDEPELKDAAELKDAPVTEKNYGMVKWGADGSKWLYKSAAKSLFKYGN